MFFILSCYSAINDAEEQDLCFPFTMKTQPGLPHI
jgi:hypothetical protein